HCDLGLTERRRVQRTIHEHLFAFVNLALFVQSLKRPPDTLHVVLVHGLVGALKVNPAANPIDYILPGATGFQHVSPGSVDVLFNTVFDNFLATIDAKLLFGVALGWQAVGVPAPNTLDALAFHGLIAWHGVFNNRT